MPTTIHFHTRGEKSGCAPKRSRGLRVASLLFISLAALLVCWAAAPASAAAYFPLTTGAPGRADLLAPQVAINDDGGIVFTWLRQTGTGCAGSGCTLVQTRVLSATGALSPIRTLSVGGQFAADPQVGIDASGNAVFTWRRLDGTNHRVQARSRSASGVLSPIQNISAPGNEASNDQIAVDENGNAVIAWENTDGSSSTGVLARARSATGVLGPVQTIATNTFGQSPQLDIDPAGVAVFAWRKSDGSFVRIQTRTRSAAGVLSPIQTLSAMGDDAFTPQVAVNASGDAIFTWSRGLVHPNGDRVQARARSAAGILSPVQTLSGDRSGFPQVGIDANGGAVFTWFREAVGFGVVQARARTAAGILSPIQTLSTDETPLTETCNGPCSPQVGVDGGGDAVLTWDGEDGVFVRGRSAAGVLSPTQSLGSQAEQQVAVNTRGDAAIVWFAAIPPTQTENEKGQIRALVIRGHGKLISARGTVQTEQGPTIGFSAANNCDPSLSTRPSIVGIPAGGIIWKKSAVTESSCTDTPPASPLDFDTQTGTATGAFGSAAPGGLNGQQGTLEWTYVDGSPDTVQLTLRDSLGNVVFRTVTQTPGALHGSPGFVKAF